MFYTIPYYYGSYYLHRNSKNVIFNDVPTQILWSHTFNVDYNGNLWIADSTKSSIMYISKELPTWNAIFKISGIEKTFSYRDGNIDKAVFNKPTSVCVYDQNNTKILLA